MFWAVQDTGKSEPDSEFFLYFVDRPLKAADHTLSSKKSSDSFLWLYGTELGASASE